MTQRTVTARSGALDISALILLAVLLAAGLILNMTLGNALAMTGIKPQFIIAAYALAILLTRGGFAQAAVFGLISAAVIQINTSVPGLNFATEVAGALTMAALVRSDIRIAGRSVTPLVAAFAATLVSGALFAVAGTVLSGFAIEAALVKVPIVAGTAVFNAIVVQALYLPLRAARRQ
ncbi:hypothetical protein H6A29_04665 [Collinsella tanakaei]|nr:hypothetical protein [Collinsella tanakaei]